MSNNYIGIVAIILALGMFIGLLACLGYTTYISVSKEKIEVHTQNFNFKNDSQE